MCPFSMWVSYGANYFKPFQGCSHIQRFAAWKSWETLNFMQVNMIPWLPIEVKTFDVITWSVSCPDTVDKMVKLMFCMISLLKKNMMHGEPYQKSWAFKVHSCIDDRSFASWWILSAAAIYIQTLSSAECSFVPARKLILCQTSLFLLTAHLSVWWKGCMCERPFRLCTSSHHRSALKPTNLLQVQVAWGTWAFLLDDAHHSSVNFLMEYQLSSFFFLWGMIAITNGFHARLF